MAGGGLGMSTNLDAINMQLKGVDRKFGAAVKKRLRAAVAESGLELVGAIKSEASWSSRIPGATSISTAFGATKASIRIRTDKKKAPHARGLEMGNADSFSEKVVQSKTNDYGAAGTNRRAAMKAAKKSGLGVGRALRHPVFGRGGYASMPTRPFFFAAVGARTPGIDKKFETAIKQIAADAGFEGV